MKVVALIPLRGGSKSIPGKNIKMLAGKPLCFWVLEAALASPVITDIFISTDSEEIKKTVLQMDNDLKLISRPAELATDEASTESTILHFMEHVEFDILITIQATSPMLSAKDLVAAYKKFEESKLDSMLSAVRVKRFFWTDNAKPINYDPKNRPRRQDFLGTLMENGAFYITKRKILECYKCRLGGKIGIYEMNASTAVEIDEPEDWSLVERLLLEQKCKLTT